MSITAKQCLIKAMGNELETILTASELRTVQEKLNDVLAMYEVEMAAEGATDADTGDFLRAFLDAKAIEGRSEGTIERYRYLITRMLDEVRAPIRQITVFHLRGYLMKEKERGMADKTLDGMRGVYCSFFGWLHKEGLLPINPCANLAPIKCAKKVKLPYTAVDIERLKECCENSRDKALISFLLSTGCRISEVCALNRNSVDFQTRETVVLGKGNKERTVFIDDVTVMLLKRYFADRKDDSIALFAGRRSIRMTPGGVRAMLRRVADAASVAHVHPHRFRRTLATNLIDRGMQLQEVAVLLGHEKLDTTMGYVYVSRDNVRTAYQKYSG
jgi:site-specific recombinase XerD